jgi:hypothetical protein
MALKEVKTQKKRCFSNMDDKLDKLENLRWDIVRIREEIKVGRREHQYRTPHLQGKRIKLAALNPETKHMELFRPIWELHPFQHIGPARKTRKRAPAVFKTEELEETKDYTANEVPPVSSPSKQQ